MNESTSPIRFDFVSLGESMLRLSVPTCKRLDDTRTLDMKLAGTESNVSVALARLGWRVGWVSRECQTMRWQTRSCALCVLMAWIFLR